MKYRLRSLTVAKVALLGVIAALAGWYLYLLVIWGVTYHFARSYALVCSILTVATAASTSAAVLLLTPQNVQRVAVSTLVMIVYAVLGCQLGDPLMQGSYDHLGGLQTLSGWLTGGVFGAVVGWLVMTAWGSVRDSSTDNTTDKLPNSDAPDPPSAP